MSEEPGPNTPAPAPPVMPHLDAILQVAVRRRWNQLSGRIALGVLVISFGLYFTVTIWQAGGMVAAVALAAIMLTNTFALALSVLQSSPLVRVQGDGIWIRSAWRGLVGLRLGVGLLGLILSIVLALVLSQLGLSAAGLFVVFVSLVNVIAGIAQPLPIVRLSGAGHIGRWVFIPWSAIREVRPSARLGLMAGIALDVDPAYWSAGAQSLSS